MNLFGGGGSKVKPQYTGLATQTSTTTAAVPIAFGQNRLAPNIIYQTDFKANKQKQKTGKGLGGKSVTYTYSGTFVLALGWGPSAGCLRVWKDQSNQTSYSALGFTFINGSIPQAPWGYLTSAHASEALGYPGLMLMCASNYDLGQSNSLPQHSFELKLPLWNTALPATGDADAAQCIDSFLNSSIYGALIGGNVDTTSLMSSAAASTTGDAAFQTYCRAMGFGISPLLESQEQALAILDRWTYILNTDMVWTGYSLFFLPRGSETITNNGVTYLPDTAIAFALTDDDFIPGGSDPVILRRKSPMDVFNSIKLEIRNRANQYNIEPIEWRDQGLVDVYGLHAQSSIKGNEICEQSQGVVAAALIGQRVAYVRNEFEFTIGPNYMRLLPGSIGTITDARFGTQTVKIIEIDETDRSDLKVIAEEYNGATGSNGAPSAQTVSNTPLNIAAPGGSINPPIIFEPPSSLAGPAAQVWMAVSGGDGTTANANWGGCFVYLSADNVTFQQVGEIDGPARMGKTTGALAAYGGANPDTVDSLGVDLTMSGGALSSVVAGDAAAAVSLCVVKDAGGALEFLSFRDATLGSPANYTLGGQLYRGLYGSSPGAHLSGIPFARLDSSIFKYSLPPADIGRTLYAKFQSFNIFNGAVEDISTLPTYSYTPSGAGYGGGAGGTPTTLATPTGSAPSGYNLLTWTASPVTDNVVRYDIYRAPGLGAAFGSAAVIGSSTGTSYTDSTATPGAAYTYFVRPVNAIGAGAASAGASLTAGTPQGNYRLYGSLAGLPTAALELFNIEMSGDEIFAAGFPSNLGGCLIAPTGAVTLPITKNGSNVGSMNIAAGATTATWTLASGLTFAAGDRFGMAAPSPADATLSGLHYTFIGRR